MINNSSSQTRSKIQSFTDLHTWKEAHKLVINIYRVTKLFPLEEKYSLTDQLRRCFISVSSNIAEGFSRQGKKEKIQFYFTAKGSLTELQNQILVAKDINYISQQIFLETAEQTIKVHKLLNGLIKSAQAKY